MFPLILESSSTSTQGLKPDLGEVKGPRKIKTTPYPIYFLLINKGSRFGQRGKIILHDCRVILIYYKLLFTITKRILPSNFDMGFD